MNEITVVKFAGELVVDSRIVAEQLGIEHKAFVRNIRNHKATIEANFGTVSFQNAPNSAVFVYLNESQSTFVMTLSRNTPKVIKCKVGLVKAFAEQKKQLEDPADRVLMNDFVSRIKDIEEKNNLGRDLGSPWDLTDEQAGQVFGMAFPGLSCEEETELPTLTEIAESIELVMSQANLGRKLVALATADAIAHTYPNLSGTMSIARKYLQSHK